MKNKISDSDFIIRDFVIFVVVVCWMAIHLLTASWLDSYYKKHDLTYDKIGISMGGGQITKGPHCGKSIGEAIIDELLD